MKIGCSFKLVFTAFFRLLKSSNLCVLFFLLYKHDKRRIVKVTKMSEVKY